MASFFDGAMRRYAAPILAKVLGDPSGVQLLRGDGTTVALPGAIVGDLTLQPFVGEDGNVVAKELLQIKVPRQVLDAAKIERLSHRDQLRVPQFGGADWHYDDQASEWGGWLIVLGAARNPISEPRQWRSNGLV